MADNTIIRRLQVITLLLSDAMRELNDYLSLILPRLDLLETYESNSVMCKYCSMVCYLEDPFMMHARCTGCEKTQTICENCWEENDCERSGICSKHTFGETYGSYYWYCEDCEMPDTCPICEK